MGEDGKREDFSLLNGSYEVYDDDDDSDDEDFMQRVNVYLNTGDNASSERALQGILRNGASPYFSKSVKFAMDEVMYDASSDDTKSRQELLSKVSKLTQLLKKAEQQSVLERNKRKKKEKTLLKLAKELKKRNSQQLTDQERIEEVGGWWMCRRQ